MSTQSTLSRIARSETEWPRVELLLFVALAADAIVTAAGVYRFGTAIEANTLLLPLWEWSLANVEVVQQPFGMDQMDNPLRKEYFVAAAVFALVKTVVGGFVAICVWVSRQIGWAHADHWARGVTLVVAIVVARNLGVFL